ncbi:hypothetical protein AMATHDRAFT_72117 [Amanita thiersii Skay4041]|uniref:N-glycosylation protein EOS1 n=1 Tax=Amanita thiersii Skay4041 TaxID=703135 RepID=A0A2A9N9P8_9AGAR|nr:hypothetical protein AMATHDRAFT_72117 [Amanita thiersii Skay4041]
MSIPTGPPPPYTPTVFPPPCMSTTTTTTPTTTSGQRSSTLSSSLSAGSLLSRSYPHAGPSSSQTRFQPSSQPISRVGSSHSQHMFLHSSVHNTHTQPHISAQSPAYTLPNAHSYPVGGRVNNDSDSCDDNEDEPEEPIYTSWRNGRPVKYTAHTESTNTCNGGPRSNRTTHTSGLRLRFLRLPEFSFNAAPHVRSGHPAKVKAICTTPGQLCAGETETETDEPPRHLPTSRIIPSSDPVIPPDSLQRLTPFLFEFSRLLAIVPALIGTLYNIYKFYRPPMDEVVPGRKPPERIDFFVSALWAILTGYQCLALTTGLLTRWRLYYPPLSTLIRLLALQGICWPATQLTLSIFEHQKRPVVVWALIGTTTCMSRSVQIWVTSNLRWWEPRGVEIEGGAGAGGGAVNGNGKVISRVGSAEAINGGGSNCPCIAGGSSSVGCGSVGSGCISRKSSVSSEIGVGVQQKARRGGYWRRWGDGGGRWGGRRWDWKEVGVKCMLPAGIMYFVMAWAEQIRREWEVGC